MIDSAVNHIEELKKKFNSIWFQDKYKYYNYNMWYDNFEVDNNTWHRHQFVSIDSNGNVIGYISYSVNRQTYNASELAIINFSDNIFTFGKDLKQVLVDIFEKFKFEKLSFSVVVGNPIEKSYDKLIAKYGGFIIGISTQETKLYDNEYYPVKYYEILRENYMRKSHPELYKVKDMWMYNCRKKLLYPPENFIPYNSSKGYKTEIPVDDCISEEIKDLWNKGIKTAGCCCGHGISLGYIQVTDDCIEAMEQLGYEHYIYQSEFGGVERKDAFIAKTYGHNYDGYSNGYRG